MDNDGCWQRKECKLKRYEYLNAGPNSVWHGDGYDKHVEALWFSHSRLHGLLVAAQSNNFPDSGPFLDAVEACRRLLSEHNHNSPGYRE